MGKKEYNSTTIFNADSRLLFFRYGLTLINFLFSISVFSQDINHIYISEFMASNSSTIMDEDGDYHDWIELYNPTASAIELGGWYLSDNPDNLIKWIFPQITVEAHGYLLIFASGKDRRNTELHTNFQLSSSGEQICLTKSDGVTIAFKFENQFPTQYPDISYGFENGDLTYFDMPTPGSPNVPGEYLSPPTFSLNHGLYDVPTNLEILTNVEDGIIKYTIDGSEPGLENGITYTSLLTIDSTNVIRAAVIKTGKVSRVTTNTYIFPEKVKNQPKLPVGYPPNWGEFSKIQGYAPADYEMDPDICQSPSYGDKIVPALKAIPTISLVTQKDQFIFIGHRS